MDAERLREVRTSTNRYHTNADGFSQQRNGVEISNAFNVSALGYASLPLTHEVRSQLTSETPVGRTVFNARASARPSSRIALSVRGSIHFIDPAEILAVEARGSCVVFRLKYIDYTVREAISSLADKLLPYGLIRVHRSYLVNRAFVETVKALPTGEYLLKMTNHKYYTLTRTYKHNLKVLADSWIGIKF